MDLGLNGRQGNCIDWLIEREDKYSLILLRGPFDPVQQKNSMMIVQWEFVMEGKMKRKEH